MGRRVFVRGRCDFSRVTILDPALASPERSRRQAGDAFLDSLTIGIDDNRCTSETRRPMVHRAQMRVYECTRARARVPITMERRRSFLSRFIVDLTRDLKTRIARRRWKERDYGSPGKHSPFPSRGAAADIRGVGGDLPENCSRQRTRLPHFN